LIKLIDIGLYRIRIQKIISSNDSQFLTKKTDLYASEMLNQINKRVQDPTAIFIGYFEEDQLVAFGQFTRFFTPDQWAMNNIVTIKGTYLPSTRGGRSADCVYDIFNFAILYFNLEGRKTFYMAEPDDPRWVSIADAKYVPALDTFKLASDTVKYKAGTIITQANGMTYLYAGLVIADLRILKFEKRSLVYSQNVVPG
jgi:hypothetical protein